MFWKEELVAERRIHEEKKWSWKEIQDLSWKEDAGDQRWVWREMSGDAQGPWP